MSSSFELRPLRPWTWLVMRCDRVPTVVSLISLNKYRGRRKTPSIKTFYIESLKMRIWEKSYLMLKSLKLSTLLFMQTSVFCGSVCFDINCNALHILIQLCLLFLYASSEVCFSNPSVSVDTLLSTLRTWAGAPLPLPLPPQLQSHWWRVQMSWMLEFHPKNS